MRLRLLHILIVSLLTIHWSCKKEELPVEDIGNPVFYVDGSVNGEALRIEAGNEGYFMETFFTFDSLNRRDILTMGGNLGILNDQSDKPWLTVLIRNNSIGLDQFTPDSALFPSKYDYRRPTNVISTYEVTFSANALVPAGGNTTAYFWDFGDGTTSTEMNPVHLYNDPNQSKYLVCLTVSDSINICSSEICSEVFLPNAACSASFDIMKSGNTFSYSGKPDGISPFRYKWTFGRNEVNPVSKDVEYCYKTNPDRGVDQVCLNITDASGCEALYCENVAIDSLVDCMANFDYNVREIQVADSLHFRTVMIEYYDGNGVTYSSLSEFQPTESVFEITKRNNYKLDRNGNRTSAITFSASCYLYSKDAAIPIVIEKGVIAVAYP